MGVVEYCDTLLEFLVECREKATPETFTDESVNFGLYGDLTLGVDWI